MSDSTTTTRTQPLIFQPKPERAAPAEHRRCRRLDPPEPVLQRLQHADDDSWRLYRLRLPCLGAELGLVQRGLGGGKPA